MSSECFSIVVIDDSPTVRKILETTLRRHNYSVKGFDTALSALQVILKPDGMPQLLFIDIEMPHMNGYEAIRRIRAHSTGESVPIIAISRRDGTIDRLKMRLAGATEFLGKPFKPEDIVACVKRYQGENGE